MLHYAWSSISMSILQCRVVIMVVVALVKVTNFCDVLLACGEDYQL